MIETSNLKQIKEKRKAVMIDYHFVTFDLLTYFYSDFTLMCRTIYCLVSSLSSNTHLWIVCEHFNLHVNFWPIDLIKFSAQRLNFPWKFSCLVVICCVIVETLSLLFGVSFLRLGHCYLLGFYCYWGIAVTESFLIGGWLLWLGDYWN